jgi:hypothetical protein
MARNVSDPLDGILNANRYPIHDRDRLRPICDCTGLGE